MAIKCLLGKCLAQEGFESNMGFRYQMIVSAIKFRKMFCKIYETDSVVKKILSLNFVTSFEVCNMAK